MVAKNSLFTWKLLLLRRRLLRLEHLRQQVRSTPFEIDDNHHIHLSISIGLAQLEKHTMLKDVIHTADQHLYVAKERGRDQLISSYHVDLIYS